MANGVFVERGVNILTSGHGTAGHECCFSPSCRKSLSHVSDIVIVIVIVIV